MSEIAGSDRFGIGARLRAARAAAGLTPIQAAEKLHLDVKVIDALEAEDFGELGAPVYVRGHLRRYAELIGESADELLDLYSTSQAVAAPPDLRTISQVEHAVPPRRLGAPVVGILVAVAVVGGIWAALEALPPPVAPADAPARSLVPAAEGPVTEESAPVTAALEGSALPALPATDEPAAVDSSAARADASSPAIVRSPATSDAQMQLTLSFAADSWVEIYDADDKRLFYDVGAADSTTRVEGRAPLRVMLGNAPGVTLQVNGNPAAIPADLRRGEAAQFVVNSAGKLVRGR